jgi:hypothetical protein
VIFPPTSVEALVVDISTNALSSTGDGGVIGLLEPEGPPLPPQALSMTIIESPKAAERYRTALVVDNEWQH